MSRKTPLNLKVLVAEDNRMNRALIGKILFNMGCQCVMASNGQEAVDLYNKQIDVVLMDINMPIKTGIEAAIDILGIYPNAIIFALSDEDDRQSLIDAGMKAFLRKPYNIDEIYSVLSESLPLGVPSVIFDDEGPLPSNANASIPVTFFDHNESSAFASSDEPIIERDVKTFFSP